MDFASLAKRCNTKLEKSISTLCTTEHSSSSRPWWWMRWSCRWFWWCWLVLHNPWRSNDASANDVAPFRTAHWSVSFFFCYCNTVTIDQWLWLATFLADYVQRFKMKSEIINCNARESTVCLMWVLRKLCENYPLSIFDIDIMGVWVCSKGGWVTYIKVGSGWILVLYNRFIR